MENEYWNPAQKYRVRPEYLQDKYYDVNALAMQLGFRNLDHYFSSRVGKSYLFIAQELNITYQMLKDFYRHYTNGVVARSHSRMTMEDFRQIMEGKEDE